MDIYDYIFLALAICISLIFLVVAIVSYIEKEKFALKKALYLLIPCVLICVFPFLEFPFQNVIEITLSAMVFIGGIVLLFPYNNFSSISDYSFSNKIDERDIMFSRRKLTKNTDRYQQYYQANPDKKAIDDQIRALPGLLDENATYYNRLLFASAEASFKTVAAFHPVLNDKTSKEKLDIDPSELSSYIKAWAKKLGALDCGITELKDYHIYSKLGRDDNYGDETNLTHKYAIAFTVEMDSDMIAAAPEGPTVMESAFQYLNAGNIAVQLSYFIKELGNDSLAHIDGKYKLVCPLVAKDAGLGEIGRMGLLMTPKYGPRVRIGVVTTDIPLVIDKPTFEPSILDFCTICKKCADACPAKAISSVDRELIKKDLRWQINQEKCFKYWATCGTDCGRCLAVCPYSHPNNLLHNLVRKGLKNSYIFRRFALKMDDYLYGRKPKPRHTLGWIRKTKYV